MQRSDVDRRSFVGQTVTAGAALAVAPWILPGQASAGTQASQNKAAAAAPKRIKVAVIGCGSVSNSYLPQLAKSPYVELVSVCDIIPERAAKAAERFHVPNHYPHIDKMLAGAPFDFQITLTDMQEHEHLNRQALEQGKHVWSEKPIANSLGAGRELLALARKKGVRLWGAPIVVQSPQFAFMAKALAAGKLGRVAAAHADYGHTGPDWSAFFYEKGGGSLPDLGVYNITTLTGLLGPARSVVAMTSVVTPTREIQNRGTIKVEAEDNSMVLLDHGGGTISHIQCGFNYFNPHGHDGSQESRHTVSLVGTAGSMGLVGYDWEPLGVDLATQDEPVFKRHAMDAEGYIWQLGACLAAECLATGKELLVKPEHALHVLEIMIAARESQQTGRRITLDSTFPWPVVA